MKRIFISLVLIMYTAVVFGEKRTIEEVDYRRNSIYSILINHDEQHYGPNIADVFLDMPLPDKYNDHDLSVKIIQVDKKTPKNERGEGFLIHNHVASHLVARWFNRDPKTGACNMDLIKERGLYSASEYDKIIAQQTIRNSALLADAGEELIHNTFVIVNDIRYIDKEKAGRITGMVFFYLIATIGAVTSGLTGTDMTSDFATIGHSAQEIMNSLKGFRVKVNTHLYRLVWDEQTANRFYTEMYSPVPDDAKKNAFIRNRDMFKLEYVGSQMSSGSEISFLGVNFDTPDEMIKKACTRAIDENIANLARNFEPFKIKVTLTNVTPLQAPIGMKEGITENTKFEVLEKVVSDYKTTYRRVAVIKPEKGMIWDNRFMAAEEGAVGSTLEYTTFKQVSGGKIYPGMLIREIGKK